MTAVEAQEVYMAVVVAQVGYSEKRSNAQLDNHTANAGSANYTKYARDLDALGYYNGRKQGTPWCCMMPDDCRVKVFGMDLSQRIMGQPPKGLGAGVKYVYQYLKAKGRFFKTPQRADQAIFVTYNADGSVKSWQHTGVVEFVKDGYVHTVEGNTSPGNQVVANGGMVCRKKYPLGDKRIYGYVRPLWEMAAAEMTKKEECEMTEKEIKTLVEDTVKATVDEAINPLDEALSKAIKNLMPQTFRSVEDVPEYWREEISALVKAGALKGDGTGAINLTQTEAKVLAVVERLFKGGEDA